MSNVVLMDICGTLFRSNTTFDFLDYYVTAKSYHRFRKLMHTSLWRYTNSFIYRLTSIDLSRRIALSYLKGKSKTELYAMAETFYHDYLLERKNEAVWQLLQEFKSQSCVVVLVSGTIDPVAVAVAHDLGIKRVVSSHLNYNDNQLCRGKLAIDALRNKRKELLKLQINPPYKHVVTDNPGDIDLASQAEATTIVYRGRKSRWKYLTHGLKNVRFLYNG